MRRQLSAALWPCAAAEFSLISVCTALPFALGLRLSCAAPQASSLARFVSAARHLMQQQQQQGAVVMLRCLAPHPALMLGLQQLAGWHTHQEQLAHRQPRDARQLTWQRRQQRLAASAKQVRTAFPALAHRPNWQRPSRRGSSSRWHPAAQQAVRQGTMALAAPAHQGQQLMAALCLPAAGSQRQGRTTRPATAATQWAAASQAARLMQSAARLARLQQRPPRAQVRLWRTEQRWHGGFAAPDGVPAPDQHGMAH